MDSNAFEGRIESLFTNTDFEIVDVKISRASGKLLIQVFIDKHNGSVNMKDCEVWSDKIGSYVDMNNIIDGAYLLEISSPGVDRIIKKEKDFKRFAGQKVKIVLKKPVEGTKVYYSKIVGYEKDFAIFEDGLKFNIDDIYEVRLNPDYEDLFNNNSCKR